MARTPNVRNGIWTRHVRESGHIAPHLWRTDCPQSVLNDTKITDARYILEGGPVVAVPMPVVRPILSNAPTRNNGNTRGPYNVNPVARTLYGVSVPMLVNLQGSVSSRTRSAWSQGETVWHRNTVARIAAAPGLVIPDLSADPIIRIWRNSTTAIGDGSPLWSRLRTAKRPDVVGQHLSGRLSPVEVEPDATAVEGLVQIVDYACSLRVDRRLAGTRPIISAVLVVQSVAARLRADFADIMDQNGIRLVELP